MIAGGHRLAGSFTVKDESYHFVVTKKPNAHRPDAVTGVQGTLAGPEHSDRDITLSFDHDRFDDDRARVSWLRAAYLTLFAVTGYRFIFSREMEIVRLQIREPKVAHIPTFLIDTQREDDWSDRAVIRVTTPEWQRCWELRSAILSCVFRCQVTSAYTIGRSSPRNRRVLGTGRSMGMADTAIIRIAVPRQRCLRRAFRPLVQGAVDFRALTPLRRHKCGD